MTAAAMADPAAVATGDELLAARRAGVVERLAALEATRKADLEARRAETQEAADPRESVAAFLRDFSERREAVEAGLRDARAAGPSGAAGAGLDALLLHVSSLDQSVADATYFLPSYESRACAAASEKLRDAIAAAREELAPKKKFSFARKPAPAAGAAAPAAGTSAAAGGPAPAAPAAPLQPAMPAIVVPQTAGVRGLTGATVVLGPEQLKGADLELSDLKDCRIFLLGPTGALRAHRLHGCRLYGGPVTGSLLIEDLINCTLMLAARQIRVHSAHACDLYLRVRSKPIIEHSDGVRVAPYPALGLPYDGGGEQLAAAGLAEESGLWAHMEDFGWLRAMQSPNWCVLPEGERAVPPECPPAPAGSLEDVLLLTGAGKGSE